MHSNQGKTNPQHVEMVRQQLAKSQALSRLNLLKNQALIETISHYKRCWQPAA